MISHRLTLNPASVDRLLNPMGQLTFMLDRARSSEIDDEPMLKNATEQHALGFSPVSVSLYPSCVR